MNLNNIVTPIIAAVNPLLWAKIAKSIGSTTDVDGSRLPLYATPKPVTVQVQALTYDELKIMDGLDIQGTRRAMYLNGNWNGVSRPGQKGGDLIQLDADKSVWLVAIELENWSLTSGWTKVGVTLQNQTNANFPQP